MAPTASNTSTAPANQNKGATTDTLADIGKKQQAILERLESLSKAGDANRHTFPGAPHARKGEDPLGSRGYSYGRLFRLMGKQIGSDHAKVEVDMHNRLQKFWHDRHGAAKAEANTILAPFASEFLPADESDERSFVREVRDVVKAGVIGWDPEEVAAIRKRMYGSPYARSKALSWTDENALGALVEPPLYGELIELLRKQEVFMNAGARMIGMPPQGRLVFPRQTGASQAFYIGESQTITDSEPTTGDLILQAKKLAALIKVPNELFRYASVSVEMFLREDMTKVMGLKLDNQLLEGVGSGNAPKGLINYSNINTYTSQGTPADANSGYPLVPEDIYNLIGKVEEQNAVFKAFVMRPLMAVWIANRRSDAVTADDGKGHFMFNLWRDIADTMRVENNSVGMLAGYPVYKSTQVSGQRTRGTGTTQNTYIVGGDFNDYVIAMSPTIEFAMTQQGDTPFTKDQTWVRAILPHDGAPRHEASFVLVDNLLYSV